MSEENMKSMHPRAFMCKICGCVFEDSPKELQEHKEYHIKECEKEKTFTENDFVVICGASNGRDLCIEAQGLNKVYSKYIPPCIELLSKGVVAGWRNMGAFALSRFYKERDLENEEILALMLEWNDRNIPPIRDRELRTIVNSTIRRNYSFGCGTIKENPLLEKYCKSEHCQIALRMMINEKRNERYGHE